MSPDWAAKPEAVPYSSLDNPQSLNLYSYVGNNPMSQIDLDGHAKQDAQGQIVTNDLGVTFCVGGPCQVSSTSSQGSGGQMSVSEQGKNFIKGYEKLRLTTYDANPPHGDWPIGWGHKVESGDFGPISNVQAEKFFSQDISNMAAHVYSDLKVSVTQNQFDALVCLRFNAGANNVTPPVSNLNRTGQAAKEDFTKHYITAGGVKMGGLETRRAAEWKIFSQGAYDAKH